MQRREYWEEIYTSRSPTEVSWYQREPAMSLALIGETGVSVDSPIIDMGSGASTLIDSLLAAGYGDITAVDISERALARTRERLGEGADRVRFIRSDATAFEPPRSYRLWHDRAVFHFLTDPADRERYRAVLERALTPDGDAVIATFAPDGPEMCSGLPIVRYDEAAIAALFAPAFALAGSRSERHHTPAGKVQSFSYFHLRRR
jgi:SAM-dependent methyltransferase